MWDDERLQYVRDNSENPGVLEEILQRHNMTAEHVEVLGQFLDLTGQSPERLKATLRTAFAREDFEAKKRRVESDIEQMRRELEGTE